MDANQSLLDILGTANNGQSQLNTLQRVLLITDGTVTDVLEAYANERIRVVKLAQEFDTVDVDQPELDSAYAQRVLRRTVLLQGSMTGINFVHAHSVFTPDHLHPEIVDALLVGNKPLGRLLAQYRVETYREIVAVGFEPAGTCADYFGVDPASKLVFRTYRIIVERRPVVRITEKFPVTWFSLSSPALD